MKHVITILIFCISMFALAGCVTKTDIDTLNVGRQQDQARIQQLEQELQESKARLQAEFEASQNPMREQSANSWAEIQDLKSEIAQLRGQFETLSIRLDRQVGLVEEGNVVPVIGKRLAEIEFVLENELQVDLPKVREEKQAAEAKAALTTIGNDDSEALVSDGKTQVANGVESTSKPVVTSVAKTEKIDPATALYDKAYDLYKQGEYEKARSYWAEYSETFKGHPYNASALFWQGQCYYKLKEYPRAVILYEDVIEKYKKSSKYKSALLRAGYAWNIIGKPDLAKLRLEEVVKSFPKSTEAIQAKKYLKKIQ